MNCCDVSFAARSAVPTCTRFHHDRLLLLLANETCSTIDCSTILRTRPARPRRRVPFARREDAGHLLRPFGFAPRLVGGHQGAHRARSQLSPHSGPRSQASLVLVAFFTVVFHVETLGNTNRHEILSNTCGHLFYRVRLYSIRRNMLRVLLC